ncbi:hypothetical protein EUGRSUZ_H02408 [Eucalyptus grandis]|uniref:Uncharacterized protein n=2 Tax=Eucalyptus grandis TaxID=71139 RepID=A0ACC3JRC2_EUCGR|nr:hypothetical protein EUGRSUZ_H02408 [Eucalyptus grandis]
MKPAQAKKSTGDSQIHTQHIRKNTRDLQLGSVKTPTSHQKAPTQKKNPPEKNRETRKRRWRNTWRTPPQPAGHEVPFSTQDAEMHELQTERNEERDRERERERKGLRAFH